MESLDAVLDQVGLALDEAAAVPLSCHRPDEVLGWACRLQRLRAQMESLACAAVVITGSLDIPALEGQRGVPAVIAANTGADPRAISSDLRLGAWLLRFDVFAGAFATGSITRRHVEALRRIENPRTTARLEEAQEYLVAAAIGCSWREFTQVLRYWELMFDPDGDEPTEQVASRSCRLNKRLDGSVVGGFTLDPISGQAVLSAIDAEVQRLFRQDAESGLVRTASQRRADALVNVVTRGAGRPDGSTPSPLVHLVFGAEALDSALAGTDGAGAGEEGSAIDPFQFERRCELVDGTPIHPRLALGVLAGAAVRRLVLGPSGEVLDLGRRARSFPPRLKEVLLTMARGRCEGVGCDAPFPWLQADHVHPWSRGGTTGLGNGQILCDPHNKAKRDRCDE